jgi:predicted MFS family arabinose efflux permease
MRWPEALRNRNFRVLYIGQAVSLLGDGMVGVALAFGVLEVTDSASSLGIVLAARMIPTVALLLAGGVIADRLPRRAVMVAADLVRLVSHGLMAALLISGAAQVWSLAVLAAVNGAGTAFFAPASTGLLPMLIPAGLLQQANALRGLAQSVGMVAGPALSGLLVATSGAGTALAVDAATFAVSAAFLLALRVPALIPREAASFIRQLRDGWREFRARDWVWGIVIAASIANMLSAGYQVLGPVQAERELGGAGAWATIVTGLGIGSVLGGAFMLRRRVERPLLVGCSLVMLWVLPWILIAVAAPTLLIAAGALLGGFGLMVFNALWESTLQAEIPAESLSRVSAYDWLGSLAFNPIGAALVGPIAAGIGVETTLIACAVIATVVNVWCLSLPGVRRVRAVVVTA